MRISDGSSDVCSSDLLRLAQLHPPELLGGIGDAAELLIAAITRDAVLVITGDFDCDGATGPAVAVRGLRSLGARQVRYRAPNPDRKTVVEGMRVSVREDLGWRRISKQYTHLHE